MALITGTALVAIVWQGAVRIVGSKLAKELVKAGAKHLTKKNFKKSYEFFKGNKKIKTSEKNKILEDLNIVTPKVKKPKIPKKLEKDLLPGIKPEESVYAYYTRMAKESRIKADKAPKKPEAPKTEVKKPKVKKPEAPKKKVKKVDTKAADKGDKIVEEVIKPTKTQKVLEQTKKMLLPNVFKQTKQSLVQYPGYYFGGKYILDKHGEIKMKEAADAIEIVKQKNLEEEKKLHKTKTEETTLGEIDLNTLASPDGHIWKTDQSGNFVLP